MNYEEAKIKAAREYAEGLFNPEDIANPEFSDSIDSYASDFMEGVEWLRYNLEATDEEVENASMEYGRQRVVNPDEYPDGVEDTAMGFQKGAEWYIQYTSIDCQSERFGISLLICMFIAILIFLFLIFRHG